MILQEEKMCNKMDVHHLIRELEKIQRRYRQYIYKYSYGEVWFLIPFFSDRGNSWLIRYNVLHNNRLIISYKLLGTASPIIFTDCNFFLLSFSKRHDLTYTLNSVGLTLSWSEGIYPSRAIKIIDDFIYRSRKKYVKRGKSVTGRKDV